VLADPAVLAPPLALLAVVVPAELRPPLAVLAVSVPSEFGVPTGACRLDDPGSAGLATTTGLRVLAGVLTSDGLPAGVAFAGIKGLAEAAVVPLPETPPGGEGWAVIRDGPGCGTLWQ
jgi:hypothetical protein